MKNSLGKRLLSIFMVAVMALSVVYSPLLADKAHAASWYGSDYRFWNQCQSAYSEVNEVHSEVECRITSLTSLT